jgi:hypothetical protein
LKFSLSGLLLLLTFSFLSAEDCRQLGTRRVLLYDNVVTITKPSAVKDSVYHYWRYFQTTAGVFNALDSIDTSRGCITLLNDAFFISSGDTVTSDLTFGLAHVSKPPADTVKFADYIVFGTVGTDANPTLILRLESAATHELVKSDTVVLGASFDPLTVGRAVAAGIGPIYTTIIEFEKKKRNETGLCAIAPRVTFSAEKTELSEGESVSLSVKLIDCDGAALSNWPVVLTASGGTLNPAAVTTNAQGVATTVFTATNLKVTALVTTMLFYVNPNGGSAVASVLPINFNPKKNDGQWVVSATYEYRSTSQSNRSAPFENASSKLTTQIDIYFGAMLYNKSPVAGTFVSDPDRYEIQKTASKSVDSYSKRHWESEAGYIDEKGNYQTHAYENNIGVPIPYVSVSDNGYTFSVKKITATQTGNGESNSVTCMKGMPTETSNEPYKADPDILLSFSITGKSIDTSYVVNETSETGGLKTTRTTQVHQTCSWEDTICMLGYDQNYSETTEWNQGFTEITQTTGSVSLTAMLSYVGKESNIYNKKVMANKKEFNLKPCYYNPVSGMLNICYSIPAEKMVKFRILDLTGKQIAKFTINKVMPGKHTIVWNASGIPAGIYLLEMDAGSWHEARKVGVGPR